MATVELAFSALPAHVRTARLIVTAVARRSGVEESLLDEVRLAVGEACSQAVEAHQLHCPTERIQLRIRDDSGRFEVVVSDTAPGDETVAAVPAAALVSQSLAGPANGVAHLGFAVIAGLVEDVDISSTASGVRVRMSWPVDPKSPTDPKNSDS